MRNLIPIGQSLILGLLLLGSSLGLGNVVLPLVYADGGVVNVAKGGEDRPGCGSITLPCGTIKYAVENRVQTGDRIQVAAGIYTDTFTIVTSSLQIYGAGPGLTIIDGQNVRGPMVSFGMGLTSSTVFSGFTIQNGLVLTNAGGFSMINSAPTIQFVIVQSNTAQMGTGGGFYLINSSPIITAAEIRRNTAITGGGLYATGTSAPVLHGNIICNNSTIQLHNAGLDNIDATANWWATNTPQMGVDFTPNISATPAILLNMGIVAGGTANLPLSTGSPYTLQITMLEGQYTPPPGTQMTLFANDVIFSNAMTTTTLSLTGGTTSTVITPTLPGQLVISAIHNCAPTEIIASFTRNVIEVMFNIYLPIILKN